MSIKVSLECIPRSNFYKTDLIQVERHYLGLKAMRALRYNKGRFLEVTEFHGGFLRGSICIPEGRDLPPLNLSLGYLTTLKSPLHTRELPTNFQLPLSQPKVVSYQHPYSDHRHLKKPKQNHLLHWNLQETKN